MQNKDVSKYIGRQIKKYRRLRGLTQKELGLLVGVRHNTISAYESGTNRPEGDALFAIAKALSINIDELFPAIKEFGIKDSESVVKESAARYTPSDIVMLPIIGRISCV